MTENSLPVRVFSFMNKKNIVSGFAILLAFLISSILFYNERIVQKTLSCKISSLRNSNDSDFIFKEEIVFILRSDGKGEINLAGRSVSKPSLNFDRTYVLTYTSQRNSSVEIKVVKVIKHPLDRIDNDFFKKNIFFYDVGTTVNLRIHTMDNGYVFYENLSPVAICVEKERK